MRAFLPVLVLCAAMHSGFAQSRSIEFSNPSFEDTPAISFTPKSWRNCGFAEESPPDVQPNPIFNVTTKAYDGKTYLGMVVRDNNTWEAVAQKLDRPLQPGQCYQLEVYLAKSENYMSLSRTTMQAANYTTPTKLRIFGGFNNCDGRQFLAETPAVTHSEWKPYVLQFEATTEAFDLLIFEVYFDESLPYPYSGNMLIDDLSALVPIPCGNPKPLDYKRPIYIKRPDIDIKPIQDPFIHWSGKYISKTEFWDLVSRNAPYVSFDASGTLYRTLPVYTVTGKKIRTNPALHSILEGLQQHPDIMLTIAVPKGNSRWITKKIQCLRDLLMDYGDLDLQIIIKVWEAEDKNYSWYGDDQMRMGVMIRED